MPATKEYFAAYYQRNKEKRLRECKEYRLRNLDKIRAMKARYREKNREKERQRIAKWHAANPDRAKIYRATRRKNHKEKERQRRAIYRAKYADKIKESGRRYRQEAKEKRAAYARIYRERDPEALRVRVRARRAKTKTAEGFHTKSDTKAIRAAQGNKCGYCREPLGRSAHLDHIIPLAKGGSNWPRNLQWLCGHCNHRKSAKHPLEFAREMGLLL